MKVKTDGSIQWVSYVGGSATDWFFDVLEASDGFIYASGASNSPNGDILNARGAYDVIVTKFTVDGEKVWTRNYGSSSYDYGYGIFEKTNGQIAIAAKTSCGCYIGNHDIPNANIPTPQKLWFFTIDPNSGNIIDNSLQAIEIDDDDYSIDFSHAEQVPDGYILTGRTNAPLTNGCPGTFRNLLLAKLNTSGQLQWYGSYGSDGIQKAHSVIQTSDGGYLSVGYNSDTEVECDIDMQAPHEDVFIVKTDPAGTLQWATNIGWNGTDMGHDAIEAT